MSKTQNSELRTQNSEVKTRSSKFKIRYVIYFLLLTSYLLLSAGCKDKVKPGTAEVKREAVTGLTLSEVRRSQIDDYYETSGTVKAKTVSVIASRMIGTVTSLKVKEGDRVHAGQVLMAIDDRDVAQRVKAAEKSVEAARHNKSLVDITYERYKKLHDEKAISQQEIDQIETQKKVAESEYERAKAGLAEAQINQGFTRITSPVSGVVTEKKTETGSMAVPGSPLLTVEDTSSYRIEANIDERLSGRLRPGMPVNVFLDSTGQEIKGQISEIVPAIDPMSRTFLVKINLKGHALKSGLYGKVAIPEGKKEAILIPKKAVVEKGHLVGTYTVDNKGIITYRLIKTGKMYNGQVEVLSGLSSGERIVVDGVEKAVDGGILK